MEVQCIDKESTQNDDLSKKSDNVYISTVTNWEIDNDKNLTDCISTVSLLQAPERTNLEDVVSLDTCVALKSEPSEESCRIEFKITNKQKIVRIAVVSEASVLEFFKQSGEYAGTVFAEFVDEFQDHAVYFAEAKIQPPSTEASIKFTRSKHKGTTMWIYGIKLILTEPTSENSGGTFDLEVINDLLSSSSQIRPERAEMAKRLIDSYAASESSFGDDMSTCLQKLGTMNWNTPRPGYNNVNNKEMHQNDDFKCNGDFIPQDLSDMKVYIDSKLTNLEKRLMDKMELMDQQTNRKLDAIMKKLEVNFDGQ